MGIGQVIRSFRGERSRRAYGEEIGVSHVAVRGFELGEYVPRWAITRAIIDEAGLSDDERHAFLDLLLAFSK